MSRNKLKSSKDETNKTPIIVAIIGLIGTVITALFGFFASVKSHEVNFSVTETAVTKTVTSTSTHFPANVIPTNTLAITPSPTMPEPTRTLIPSFGDDISSGCITSGYWKVYSNEELLPDPPIANCWDLSEIGISAQNNGLLFFSEPPNFGFNWIYTRLPSDVIIEFIIKIDQLTFGNNQEESMIAIGIAPADSSKPFDDGSFLVFTSKEAGQFGIGTKNLAGYESPWTTSFGSSGRYSLDINGLIMTIKTNNNSTFSPMSIPFSNRNLYIGYNAPRGSWIWSTITNLSIQVKTP